MSLACAAQLLDSLGEPEDALDRLADAAALTEISGSGVPFLGWSRQGSPIEGLLTRLATFSSSDWVKELAQASAGHADVISSLDASTPLRGEAREPVDSLVLPGLSSREREVIGELARGATYADIGATLFLSENTVKTHVSSLYTKLGVSRRSEALAVARAHHII
jgi:DNA-binding CsgD family transcriptional regulator